MGDLIYFPSQVFLASAYVGAMVLMFIAAIFMQEKMKINSVGQWVIFLILAPAPALFSITLAKMVLLPHESALPPSSLAILLGFLVVHFLLPAVMEDFQTDKASTSMVLAFLLGVAVFGAGVGTGQFTEIIPGQQKDLFGTTKVNWDDATPQP